MKVNGPEDQQALQKDLAALEDWTNLWQLRFNAQKCKVMHLGTISVTTCTKMDKKSSSKSQNSRKTLAYTWTLDSTFSSHCEQKVNKATKPLGMIRRSYT